MITETKEGIEILTREKDSMKKYQIFLKKEPNWISLEINACSDYLATEF